MGGRKVFARVIAASAALAVPFWMTASPASALESYTKTVTVEQTITTTAGDEVTCDVEFTSRLSRVQQSVPYDAEASTQVLNDYPGGEQCTAALGVEVAYRDHEGTQRYLRAFGTDLADLQASELGTTFVATHSVFFRSCAANCELSYTTSPK